MILRFFLIYFLTLFSYCLWGQVLRGDTVNQEIVPNLVMERANEFISELSNNKYCWINKGIGIYELHVSSDTCKPLIYVFDYNGTYVSIKNCMNINQVPSQIINAVEKMDSSLVIKSIYHVVNFKKGTDYLQFIMEDIKGNITIIEL